jgi:RimJ/RimL family protein N-acetyltransferase
MEYRLLTKDDIDTYFENRLRALQNAPTAFLTTYEEEQSRGRSHFERTLLHTENERAIFGAISNRIVIGTIGLFREERPKINHKATIWGMYVDVDQRGKGVGAKLLDLAIQFAKEQMNVVTVNLSVESSNLSAKALYSSRGFKSWGLEPLAMRSASGEYSSEDHMSLILTK